MKVLIKLLFLFLILAGMGPFFIKGPKGRPLLTVDDMHFPSFPSFSEISSKAKPISQSGTSEQANDSNSLKAYKWKDENGIAHYSDQHNPRYNSQLTEIKDITILPVYQTDSEHQSNISDSSRTSELPGLTTIPLQQIPKLIEDAKQLSNLLEERKKRQDRIIDQSQ